MQIIQGRRRKPGGYLVPAGGSILWYGVASNIPSGWEIVNAAKSVFVMGADTGEASDVVTDSDTHNHDNPAATSEKSAHTHPLTGTLGATGSGSTTFFGSGSNGTAPGGHGHGDGSGTSSANGAHSHLLSPTKDATVYPPYKRLYWIKTALGAVLPVGGIVMWDGAIASIPEVFSMCNGAGSTPDLRDDFIYGASVDGDVNDAGGTETHSHENNAIGAGGGHTHSMNVTSGSAPSNSNGSGYAGANVSAGGHRHGLSATTDSDPDHNHTLGDTGFASSVPPYMMLYFIMREG